MAKKFIVEVPDNYFVIEIFGSMMLPCGNDPVTANLLKKQLERGFYLVDDIYFAELRGPIIVTEIIPENNTGAEVSSEWKDHHEMVAFDD